MGADVQGDGAKQAGASGLTARQGGWPAASILALVGLVALFIYVKSRFDALEQLAGSPAGNQLTQSYLPPQQKTVKLPAGLSLSNYYVPVDSQIYHSEGRALPLESTLVLRNPNPEDSVYVVAVDYFAEDGRKLRTFAKNPFELEPFQKLEFSGKRASQGEAPGSHFVVKWGVKNRRVRPMIESIMVDRNGHVALRREGVLIRSVSEEVRRPLARGRPTRVRDVPPTYKLKSAPPSDELREKNPPPDGQ